MSTRLGCVRTARCPEFHPKFNRLQDLALDIELNGSQIIVNAADFPAWRPPKLLAVAVRYLLDPVGSLPCGPKNL